MVLITCIEALLQLSGGWKAGIKKMRAKSAYSCNLQFSYAVMQLYCILQFINF